MGEGKRGKWERAPATSPQVFGISALRPLTAADQHAAAAEDEWNEWTGMDGTSNGWMRQTQEKCGYQDSTRIGLGRA